MVSSKLNRLSNKELFLIVIALLVVFGFVSAFIIGSGQKAELAGCCDSGNLVMNKNRQSTGFFYLTYWNIEKFANANTVVNSSNQPVKYWVNVTELTTENGTLIINGVVSVKNTGNAKSDSAFLGNVVVNLVNKSNGWKNIVVSDIVDYNDSNTVFTCDVSGGGGSVVPYSKELGSGNLLFTDQNGNDPFALTSPYEIPPDTNFYLFNYSASFDLADLNISPGSEFREEVIVTFFNSSKTTGAGTCSGIDVNGDGITDNETQSLDDFGKDAGCGGPNNPCPTVPQGISTKSINLSDQISSSPDPSIVSVPNFTINNTGILRTDGSNTFKIQLNGTGVYGTKFSLLLNSTATCKPAVNGITFIRNKAWIDAADLSVVSGSPTYSQINFICGNVTPPNISIGDVCTFTQDSYGGLNTTGFNVMDANATFPLVVGNNGGPYTLTLTNATNVQDFLPQNGTPSYLTASLTDPGPPPSGQNFSTSAKQFAGEVVALALNVELSDAGKMPQNSSTIFGDLQVQNTSTTLDGKTVRTVLGIANCLLANGSSCSGYTTANITTVNDVLVKLNLNYYNCQNDFNYTKPPDNTPPVVWSVEAVPGLVHGGQQYKVRINATDDIGVVFVNITVNGVPYNSFVYNSSSGFWERMIINAPGSDGTYTIYADAFDASGNKGSGTGSLVVDANAPVISLIPPPTNNSVIKPGIILNFSVTDANLDSVMYNISLGSSQGSTLVPFPSPYDINTSGWADGQYTIYIYANDTVGNNNSKVYAFYIDSTPPTVSVTAGPNVTNTSGTVNFTSIVNDPHLDTSSVYLQCSDSVSFSVQMTCSVSGPSYTCTYSWNPTSDGLYTCNVTASDTAGNSATSSDIDVIIDSTAPEILLNSPSPSGDTTYIQPGTKINLTVTNEEFDGLESVWYSVNGSANTTLSNATDPYYYITTTGECVHIFDIWAEDTAGNIGHEQYVFNIDATPPAINSVSASPDPMYTGDVYHLVVNSTDLKMMKNVSAVINGVFYELTHNLSSPNLWYADPSAPGVAGTYPIAVTSFDMAGNNATNSGTSITVNSKPGPVITLYSPTNGDTIKKTVPVVVNITSPVYALSSAWYYSSNDPANRSFDPISVPLYTINLSGYSDGLYYFYIFANNTQGITSNETYWFTIDSTTPVLGPLSVNDTIFPSNTYVNFSINVNESYGIGNAIVRCDYDSSSFEFALSCPGSGPSYVCSAAPQVSEPDGVYYCTATVTDEAGNSATSSPPVSITIDSTPPSIILNSPLPTGIYITAGTIIDLSVTNGVYDALDKVSYQVDGGLWQPFNPPYDINTTGYSDGLHCFNVTANDTAGNTATLSDFCYKFDSTPPVIHSISPMPNYITPSGLFDISVNATDTPFPAEFQQYGNVTVKYGLAQFELSFNATSGLWEGTGLQLIPPPEQCGYYDIEVIATDMAGNSVSDNATIAVIGCYPEIVLYTPPEGVIAAGTTLDFDIHHPFPVTANYSVDGGGKIPFSSPFDVSSSGWPPGNHIVFIEAVDQYGYYSNATFSFTVPTIIPPHNGGSKQFSVSSGTSCEPDKVTFTTMFNSEPVSGATVRLVLYDPWEGIVGELDSDSNGHVSFTLPNAGNYRYYVTKPGYTGYDGSFDYTLCIKPPECENDSNCPSGEKCVNGECKPECEKDADCPSGEKCVNGECKPGCEKDSDCPTGEICIGNSCRPECISDADCKTCQTCENSKCVQKADGCIKDADCSKGYTCDACECKKVTLGIDGQPPENPVVNPNSTATLEFTITNNGTAPIHDVFVTVDGGFTGSSTTIPVLNPGESGTIAVTMPVGNVLPGDYTITAIYGSDEISSTGQFVLKVSEVVTPGFVWANLVQCLIPALVLLLLGLLYWFFLRKKIVVDPESLKELAKANKLSFMNKYLVPESVFAKLGKDLRSKCEAVKVSKAEVTAIMKKDNLSEDDAMLVAVALKAKAKNIISESKSFAKFAKLHEKLESVEFALPESIIKGGK